MEHPTITHYSQACRIIWVTYTVSWWNTQQLPVIPRHAASYGSHTQLADPLKWETLGVGDKHKHRGGSLTDTNSGEVPWQTQTQGRFPDRHKLRGGSLADTNTGEVPWQTQTQGRFPGRHKLRGGSLADTNTGEVPWQTQTQGRFPGRHKHRGGSLAE